MAKLQTLKKRLASVEQRRSGKDEPLEFVTLWGSYETHSLLANDGMTREEWEESYQQAIGWKGSLETV